MIPTLASITLRGLVNRRRTLLLALVGLIMVVVAFLIGLSASSESRAQELTGRVLGDFGLGVLLPLVAVIVGTAAIGSELEDGTIIYLLSKPIPRWLVVVVKLLVVWLVVVALVAPAMLLAGILGAGDASLAVAYAVAAIVGAIVYGAVFVAVSVITSRALIIGLAYVVIWEGVVAGLFAGTRLISIRQHALAVADALGPEGTVPAELDPLVGLIVAAVVTVLAALVAVRRLETVELRGETA